MVYRTLRIEGEVIEIIGEIVSCLGEKQAEWARAFELLERLGTHELTGLILKKHPEVVNTIAKVCYTNYKAITYFRDDFGNYF